MTAILLGISLTMAVNFSDAPKPDVRGQTTKASPVVAAAPATPLMQEMPTRTAEESDALAGIRIVDPSWDKKISCNEGTWPYIEQRCLVKDERRSAAKIENKIGPRMIGSSIRPAAPEKSGPIGSTTAIVPAAPKVNVTDGVAVRDADIERREDIESREEKHEKIAPEPVLRTAPPKPVEIRTAPAETRTSTVTVQNVEPRYIPSSPRRRAASVRTFRLSEETTKPVVTPRRAASVKRKRQTYVADAGRRSYGRVVTQAQAPQAPQFFFPFGWFVQAR